MKITEVRVEQFGNLRDVELTALSPGLNVVFVPDVAARTALSRFPGRILYGREQNQPASPGSNRLGSVTIGHAGAAYRLVRIDRAEHPDALAICSVESETAGTEALRKALVTEDRRLIDRVCLVSADQWECRAELPMLVDRLPRRPSCTAPGTHSKCPTDRRLLAVPEQRCEQLRLEICARTRSETRRQQEYASELRRLDRMLCEAATIVAWFDEELQAAVCDLHEAEDRLWMPAAPPDADHTATHCPKHGIHGYAEHLRQVIGDLAERRLKLSRLLAGGTGGGGAAQDLIRTENERLRIDRCEAELLHQLRCLAHAHATHSGHALDTVRSRPGEQPVREETQRREHVDQLRARCEELQRQLDAARSRQHELSVERRRLDNERRRSAADRALDARWYELSVVQQQLADAAIERQATELLAAVQHRLEVTGPTVESVCRRAAALLPRLVGEDSGGQRCAANPVELPVDDGWGELRSLRWLRGASSEQAELALRLALLTSMAERGIELPVVWDEALGDTDRECLRAAGRLLAEFAQNGQQFVLLTSRSEVAETLAECGATRHNVAMQPPPTVNSTEAALPLEAWGSADEDEPAAEPLVRIHPADPYWLRADSSLNELPSLGPQMARQLRRMGLVDIGDLIALNLSRCQFLLSESRLTADQVRLWQAEAVLLSCVPDLTGRDAQLLVSCGMLTPAELAAANADKLALRIDRLRGGDTARWHSWVGAWPRAETVRSWVHAARRARPLEVVFAASARARRHPFRSAPQQGPAAASATDGIAGRQSSPIDPAPHSLRLRPDSPVVDAPSIGHKTARLLQRIGIVTIGDLLACDAEATARRIRHRRITADVLVAWQRQAALMCAIPDLRCGDAQVLVACGIHRNADLLRISASALYAIVGPFVETVEGRRLLRSATPPTAEDVARWVESAQRSGMSRAA